jgi:hypothetical protein
MGIRSLKTASISTGVKRSKVWDQSAQLLVDGYESIATQAVGSGGASSITFSSIPSTYKHLQIRNVSRQVTGSGPSDTFVTARFNGDTAGNYMSHYFLGDGSSAGAGATSVSSTNCWFGVNATGNAGTMQANIIDILDYANTSKHKTIRVLSGSDRNGSGVIVLQSALWMNTAAMSSIVITGTFTEYSHFALYGIKG